MSICFERSLYTPAGRYRSYSDGIYTKNTSFEHRVRNRCALLNGFAYSFERVRKNFDPNRRTVDFDSGTLVEWQRGESAIHVMRLYRNDAKWDRLMGDNAENFLFARVKSGYILAITKQRLVYCWRATTLERLAKYGVSYDPIVIDASLTTIIANYVVGHGRNLMQLYTLETETRSEMKDMLCGQQGAT